jgi:uncharacterized protein (AIM24 family)
MPTPPTLLPTTVDAGEGPGVAYRIKGELAPVLHIRMTGQVPIYFEHHVILWKDPAMTVGMHSMKGAFKRLIAGMPVFMTECQSAGEVAFSRDDVGHVLSIHLKPAESILVREHQFLAAHRPRPGRDPVGVRPPSDGQLSIAGARPARE